MEYRLLGRTGVLVSPLCLGAMNFGGPTPEDESIRIIHKALDAGINFIDTANRYVGGESERVVGRALSDGRRDKVILATKFHGAMSEDPNDQGNSRRHIVQAVEDSLRRLDTEWIDLYQVHRVRFDIPPEETLRALDDLVHQGKVRYIGCSTFPAWKVMESLAISERYNLTRFVTEQPPYNLLDRRIENELVPLALRYSISLMPWSPLANGILAGRYTEVASYPKYSRFDLHGKFASARLTVRSLAASQKIAEVADRHQIPQSQLALAWLKDQPAVAAPILGPRTESHLDDALPVLEMQLDPDITKELDEIVPPGSAVADFHNTSRWIKMKLEVEIHQ